MSIFSQTLAFLRQRNNLTREQLADSIGVSPSHIKRLETDYISPDEKIIEKIADFFSVTAAYLTGSTSRHVTVSEPGIRDLSGDYLLVPVLSARSAANATKISEPDILDHIVLTVSGNKRSHYLGILIEDDDTGFDRMQKGDIAIVEITNQIPKNALAAVSYRGGAVFFRRYARLGPTVILTSDNNYFDRTTYDVSNSDYSIIGRVISFQGSL